MWLLAVESSGREASVALLRDDRLVALAAPRPEQQHAVQLFRNLEEALTEAGVALDAVDVYAVANGPGAFTALRVGLTLVKGLAEAHDKPVVPVSVLEAVCESANADGLLIPLVNAYRGQVFGGVYEKNGGEAVRRGRERVETLPEFLAGLERGGVAASEVTFVGAQMMRWAAELDRSVFAGAARESISPILAEAVGRCALRRWGRGEAVSALELEANYVRRSDAELLWKPK